MTKKLLTALIAGILSVFAAACGDAGGDVDGEAELGEEVADQHDVDENQDLEEEIPDGGLEDDEEELEPEPEDPFCGDGVVDDSEECDDGNGDDGDGCSMACEIEVLEAFATGDVRIDLIVDDLASNEEPLEQTCIGEIELEVTGELLVGDGRCFLPANFMDYSLEATVAESGIIEGQITVVLNNGPHDLPVTGSLDGGVLTLAFDGVTLIVGNIRGIWDGTIDAEFD